METTPNLPNTNFQNPAPPPVENKKLVAGLCAILIGTLGIHKFVLGYSTEGIIYIAAFFGTFIFSFITCGIGTFLFIPLGAIPLIEGIIYLTKTDEEFYQTYQVNKRAWF